MMRKFVSPLFFVAFLMFTQNIFGQAEFYDLNSLKSDFKQVDAVVYVKIKSLKIKDTLGGDCLGNKGTGYCLYELTAEIKEVFKGKIFDKILKFYTSADTDYPKEKLLGEKVIFLTESEFKLTKTQKYFTLENSDRKIKYGILTKLRKIKKIAG